MTDVLSVFPFEIALLHRYTARHDLKAESLIEVTESGTVTCTLLAKQPNKMSRIMISPASFAKLSQPKNALGPIERTESGIEMLVKFSQPTNAQLPIEVTESGMVMLVRLVQPAKVEALMEVRE